MRNVIRLTKIAGYFVAISAVVLYSTGHRIASYVAGGVTAALLVTLPFAVRMKAVKRLTELGYEVDKTGWFLWQGQTPDILIIANSPEELLCLVEGL